MADRAVGIAGHPRQRIVLRCQRWSEYGRKVVVHPVLIILTDIENECVRTARGEEPGQVRRRGRRCGRDDLGHYRCRADATEVKRCILRENHRIRVDVNPRNRKQAHIHIGRIDIDRRNNRDLEGNGDIDRSAGDLNRPASTDFDPECGGPTAHREPEQVVRHRYRDSPADAERVIPELEPGRPREAERTIVVIVAGDADARESEQIQIQIHIEIESRIRNSDRDAAGEIESVEVDPEIIDGNAEARCD